MNECESHSSTNTNLMANNKKIYQSENYIWTSDDKLGKGSFGEVYRCKHKETGEFFAVKTFHVNLMQQHNKDLVQREFNVLSVLDHKNIVRFIAKETNTTDLLPVVIMELCRLDNLYVYLQKPENHFGLDDSSFLTLLKDIAAGLDHLRTMNIVHRDIKPMNILLDLDENGKPIYKLTDFGSARQLKEDETFMSLHGTVEYLHPHMYERYILLKGKTEYNANVDLWSLGVTLYHAATGGLPFIPFGGVRGDYASKQYMFEMTSTKSSGVISGKQEVKNGLIIWSKELPETCQISRQLARYIENLLAGLMEIDEKYMLTFEDFFAKVEYIKQLKVVNYFIPHLGHMECAYLQEGTLTCLKEMLKKCHPSLEMENLLFFCKGSVLKEDNFVTELESNAEPIIVGTSNFVDLNILDQTCFQLPKRVQENYGQPMLNFTLMVKRQQEYAKECLAYIHQVKRKAKQEECKQQYLDRYVHYLNTYIELEASKLERHVLMLALKYEFLNKKIDQIVNIGQSGDFSAEQSDDFSAEQYQTILVNLANSVNETLHKSKDYYTTSQSLIKKWNCPETCLRKSDCDAYLSRFCDDVSLIHKEIGVCTLQTGADRHIFELDCLSLEYLCKASLHHLKSVCMAKFYYILKSYDVWSLEAHQLLGNVHNYTIRVEELLKEAGLVKRNAKQHGNSVSSQLDTTAPFNHKKPVTETNLRTQPDSEKRVVKFNYPQQGGNYREILKLGENVAKRYLSVTRDNSRILITSDAPSRDILSCDVTGKNCVRIGLFLEIEGNVSCVKCCDRNNFVIGTENGYLIMFESDGTRIYQKQQISQISCPSLNKCVNGLSADSHTWWCVTGDVCYKVGPHNWKVKYERNVREEGWDYDMYDIVMRDEVICLLFADKVKIFNIINDELRLSKIIPGGGFQLQIVTDDLIIAGEYIGLFVVNMKSEDVLPKWKMSEYGVTGVDVDVNNKVIYAIRRDNPSCLFCIEC